MGFGEDAGEEHAVRRRYSETTGEAKCHGDSHGRKRSRAWRSGTPDRTTVLRARHPAADLTRLELSVFLTHFRAFG